MVERSCRRTASAQASISVLIWVSAAWPCRVMALLRRSVDGRPQDECQGAYPTREADFFHAGVCRQVRPKYRALLAGAKIPTPLVVSHKAWVPYLQAGEV